MNAMSEYIESTKKAKNLQKMKKTEDLPAQVDTGIVYLRHDWINKRT